METRVGGGGGGRNGDLRCKKRAGGHGLRIQKMERLKRKRDRWGQREGEKAAERQRELKKKTTKKTKSGSEQASEQQCQKRATVVVCACCRLARHQLARGRCNWERWVIMVTNLPLNTCACPLEASLVFSVSSPPTHTPHPPTVSPPPSHHRLRLSVAAISLELSRRTHKDLLGFSTGVCGSSGRRAPPRSCKFQISLCDCGGPPDPMRICVNLQPCGPAKRQK